MNAPNDPRPTRTDLDRELVDLLGSDDAGSLRAAADPAGHARRVEQATRNLSVDVTTALQARRPMRRLRVAMFLVPTLAAAVAAFLWLMPDATSPIPPTAPPATPQVTASTDRPEVAPTPTPAPQTQTVMQPDLASTRRESATVELDNTITTQVLDEIASSDVVDGIARTAAPSDGVTSITDTDIDNLLAGL